MRNLQFGFCRSYHAAGGGVIAPRISSAFGMMELDIYGCFNGRAVFIEVKRPGGKATERQEREIEKWRAVGALTGCATTPQEALSIINQRNCDEDI